AELVATLPAEAPGIARPTDQVVRQMIQSAARELIILGYELTDQNLVSLLAEAACRGVAVIVICDRGRGVAGRLRELWPSHARPATIFQDRDRPGSAIYASMHAKCLLIDAIDLLVTSANFTFHGLRENIEIGIRLGGDPAAEARKIFSY